MRAEQTVVLWNIVATALRSCPASVVSRSANIYTGGSKFTPQCGTNHKKKIISTLNNNYY